MDPDRDHPLNLHSPVGTRLPERPARLFKIGRRTGHVPMDDWKLWKNTHQGQCPGVAVGNFYPKSDSSFVVALLQQIDEKRALEKVLLVTMKKNLPITEVVASPIEVTPPSVVWRLPPGHYGGVDGTTASISRDSFVYERVASTAKQFYYHGSHLESFVISN